MNPYPSYKNSGVEWIGEIPTDWLKTKLKFTLEEIVTGGTPDTSNDVYWSDEESGINWISISDITSNGRLILKTKKFISKEGLESKKIEILPMGSLIYSIYGSIGKVSRLGIPSTIHQGILGLKTNSKLNSIFLEYYLIYFKEYISLFSSSNTQENLNQEKVSNFQIPFPSPQEQTQIVSFLDTKTQKIDELIEKTEQKIKLLKEKRTSLINHCVTKGLNPNVEMKDSGVEWIGEIPNHWGVKLLKFVFNSIREKSETGEEELLSVLIKKGVVRRRDFLGEDSDNLTRSESLVGYIHCSKGNLVNNIMKMGFYCLGISDYDGIVSPGYSVFEMIDNNDYPKYWDYLLKTEIYVSEYRKRSKGIQESRMRLYDDYFLSIHSLYPPKTEQTKIIEHLDEQTQKIDSTVEKESQRIELLKEYRQSLISEVVTGKVDVRGWNGN